MAIAGTRARLVTFEPTGGITARNVQDAISEAAGGGGGGGGGSQTLAEVLAEGSDPDGTPITGPLEVTLAAPGTPLSLFAPGAAATVTTGAGNSGLVWTAVAQGQGGNVAVEIAGADPDSALQVYLGSQGIGVTLARDGGGAVTTTAAQLLAAVNAEAEVGALVQLALASGSNGSGLMTNLTTALSGGFDGTDQDTFEPRLTTLPIADTAGVSIRYFEDQIGNGNQIACLVFPEDTTAVAIAIEGDDYPRWILGADPENNGLSMGDGSDDASGGPGIYFDGGNLGLNGYVAQVTLGEVLGAGNNAGGNSIAGLADPSGDQDAATKKYVDDFPVVVPENGVTEPTIADGAVAAFKLGDLAVLTAKIADGAVTADKTNLPTSNPGPGLVWNDGGVWKVGS